MQRTSKTCGNIFPKRGFWKEILPNQAKIFESPRQDSFWLPICNICADATRVFTLFNWSRFKFITTQFLMRACKTVKARWPHGVE